MCRVLSSEGNQNAVSQVYSNRVDTKLGTRLDRRGILYCDRVASDTHSERQKLCIIAAAQSK
jgi:hypothetical protein